MKNKYKLVLILLFVALLSLGGIFYLRFKVYYAKSDEKAERIFSISKGEGSKAIASNLEKNGLVSGKTFFYYYLWSHKLANKIYPGEYLLSGNMTIPEIAVIITNPQKIYETVLFKEGWSAKQMSDELMAHNFDGKEFLALVNNPPKEVILQFAVFSDKSKSLSLEGYLFPDTYYFSRNATLEGILKKILDNTDTKVASYIDEIKNQNKSIAEILTMASILEKEVRTDEDRAVVSGIFWNRIKIGQALQSCATLAYVLGEDKKQYSYADIQTVSPYNTYQNKGLPPGPICNPGLSAIKAAIYPVDSNYNFFLSDPKTGKTIFSKTYAEHVANKAKYGL